MSQKEKRVNKTKEELADTMAQQARVERLKKLAALMWPILEKQATIYDAQTVVTATGGFIKHALQVKQQSVLVLELEMDTSAKDETEVTKGVQELIELLKTESADSIAAFLERFGQTLSSYGAKKYLENPMTNLTFEEFIKS